MDDEETTNEPFFLEDEDLIPMLASVMRTYPFEYGPTEVSLIFSSIKDRTLTFDSSLETVMERPLKEKYPSKEFFLRDLRFLRRIKRTSDNPEPFTRRHIEQNRLWPYLSHILENNELAFTYWGERRGRRYKHRSARSMLLTKTLVEVSIYVLNRSIDPMSWRDVWRESKGEIKQIHKSLESPDQYFSSNLKLNLSDTEEQILKAPYPQTGFDSKDSFEGDFESWFEDSYTSDWFFRCWPVIQRSFPGRDVIHVPGRRGMWMTREAHQQSNNETENDIMVALKSQMNMIQTIRSTIQSYKENNLELSQLQKTAENEFRKAMEPDNDD